MLVDFLGDCLLMFGRVLDWFGRLFPGFLIGSKDLSTYFNTTDKINIAGVNNQEDLNSSFKLLSKNKTFMKDLSSYRFQCGKDIPF